MANGDPTKFGDELEAAQQAGELPTSDNADLEELRQALDDAGVDIVAVEALAEVAETGGDALTTTEMAATQADVIPLNDAPENIVEPSYINNTLQQIEQAALDERGIADYLVRNTSSSYQINILIGELIKENRLPQDFIERNPNVKEKLDSYYDEAKKVATQPATPVEPPAQADGEPAATTGEAVAPTGEAPAEAPVRDLNSIEDQIQDLGINPVGLNEEHLSMTADELRDDLRGPMYSPEQIEQIIDIIHPPTAPTPEVAGVTVMADLTPDQALTAIDAAGFDSSLLPDGFLDLSEDALRAHLAAQGLAEDNINAQLLIIRNLRTGTTAPATTTAPGTPAPAPIPLSAEMTAVRALMRPKIEDREAAADLLKKVQEGIITLDEAKKIAKVRGATSPERKKAYDTVLAPLEAAAKFNRDIVKAPDIATIMDKVDKMVKDKRLSPVEAKALQGALNAKQEALAKNQALLTAEQQKMVTQTELANAKITSKRLNRIMYGVRTFGPGVALFAGGAASGFLTGNWYLAGALAGAGIIHGGYSMIKRDWKVYDKQMLDTLQQLEVEKAEIALRYQNRKAEAEMMQVQGVRGMAESVVQLLAKKYPKPPGMSEDEYEDVIRQQINSANTQDLEAAVRSINFALSTSADN